MLTLLLQFVLLILSDDAFHGHSQEEKIYTVSEVDIKPQPVRGLDDFQKRWSRKVVYPEDAIKDNVQGMVFIEFVVNHDGTIVNPTVKLGLNELCDQAALKGFREAGKESWKPAVKNGNSVKVKMVLPFVFKIIKR